eukprot:1739830-Alexandrium_andersonii.AAC.1
MSASLVGSEMCIRDRLAPSNWWGRFMEVSSFGALSGPRPKQFRHLCPVSYTHLTLPTICSV